MSNCIVCKLPLTQIEKDLLMSHHRKCSVDVIRLALKLLDESDNQKGNVNE